MIEVSVVKLGLDSVSNSYVVILQEKGGDRMLPIWIGQPEAESIVMEMNGIKPPRPLTHDLCKRLITGMGASLQRVQITKVQDNTYFAELHLHRGGDIVHIDARPSDSIAIALRFSAPIYAQESLLSTISIEDAGGGGSDDEEPSISAQSQATQEQLRLDAEALKEYLEKMRPEDFGKFNL
jgi:bifunctional DNase/RNase